jgi:hypothetical protein
MMSPAMRDSFDSTSEQQKVVLSDAATRQPQRMIVGCKADSRSAEERSGVSLGIEWGRFLLFSGALLGFIYLSLSPTFRTSPTHFEMTILWFGYFSTLGLAVLNVIQLVRRIKARSIKRNSQRA